MKGKNLLNEYKIPRAIKYSNELKGDEDHSSKSVN